MDSIHQSLEKARSADYAAVSENQAGTPLDEGQTRSTAGIPAVNRHSARELRLRVDLVAIAARFTRLRRLRGQYVGLCPLHSERHPSFYVHPEKQVFHCFGCGAGGDVFAFVMGATGCHFRRALEIVAAFLGDSPGERAREARSRFRAGVRASLPAAQRRDSHSQSLEQSRARTLAELDAADRRLRAIEATNRAAHADLATACEPERDLPILLEETR